MGNQARAGTRRGARTVGVASLVALALVGASCGSRARLTKAEYQRQLTSITTSASAALAKIFSSPALQNPTSVKSVTPLIREGAKTLQHTADQFDSLRPPADVETDNDDLVKGFGMLADELGSLADAAEKAQPGNDAAALAQVRQFDQQAASSSLPSQKLLQQATNDLKRKGYQIGSG